MTGVITVCILLAVILLVVLYGITMGSLLSSEQSRAEEQWKQMRQIMDRRAAAADALEQADPQPWGEPLAEAVRAFRRAGRPEQAVPLAGKLNEIIKSLLERPEQEESTALAALKGRFYAEENQFRTLSKKYNEHADRYNHLVENFPSSTAAVLFHYGRWPLYEDRAIKEVSENE